MNYSNKTNIKKTEFNMQVHHNKETFFLHKTFLKFTEKLILNNRNKVCLIALLLSFQAFSTTCLNNQCIKLFNTNLQIPVDYQKTKGFKKMTYFVRTGSSFTYYAEKRTVDCKVEILCDLSKKVLTFSEMDQKYEMSKKYSCQNANAILWRQTTMSGEEEAFIGVIFSQDQLLSVYGDQDTWQQWVNKLTCTESKID